MNPAPIYAYEDYKTFIQAKISESSREWGSITRLAQAAGCQRSFLSRVLSTHVHLTIDQGYGLCEFWRLTSSETEYFLILLEIARTASKTYRGYLESKRSTLKRAYEDLAERVSRPKAETGAREYLYYSAWYWAAIHMLVSIPEYQTVASISKRLQLSDDLVHATLQGLQEFGYVRKHEGSWKFNAGEMHVGKESPLVALHHSNWRQRAVLDAQSPRSKGIHFSVVQSMSREVEKELRNRLLQFIDEAARLAGPSREEKLVSVTIDLFEP